VNDPLSIKVAEYLANLTYWGTQAEIHTRWQRESGKLSPAEFSYRLSDEFDQSILYLPLAFDCLQDAPKTEIASRAITSFLSYWHKNLNACGMQEAVADRCMSILEFWLGKFPAHEESSEFRSPDCIVDTFAPLIAINLLNELVEKKVPAAEDPNKLLADKLLCEIFDAETSAAQIANMLAFLLKVKATTSEWKIYRHPMVLDAAFNVEACKQYARRVSDLLKKKTAEDYLNLLRVHLLGGPASC
jgi:hypothetical protein